MNELFGEAWLLLLILCGETSSQHEINRLGIRVVLYKLKYYVGEPLKLRNCPF